MEVQAHPTMTLKVANNLHALYKPDGVVILTKSNFDAPTLNPKTCSSGSNPSHQIYPYESDSDIVWHYELKENSEDVQDNRGKVILVANHLLYNDPSRRFTFSLTIEKRNARLWFFSRSLVMCTVEFDWLQDHMHLVYFLVSLAFATKVELGFDPSIERIKVDNEIKYNIRCGGKWYRVLDTLEDFKAARVLGRATRVWRVREIEDGSTLVGDVLVMKDVWINESARSEKEILDDIILKVNTVHDIGQIEPDFASKYFIQIKQDERVQIEVNNQLQDDCTSTIVRGHVIPAGVKALPVSQLALHGSPTHATGPLTDFFQSERSQFPHTPLLFKGYTAKQHRRILYAEYGTPLSSSEILADHKRFFTSLSQGLVGLKLLYSAGYVHRDPSLGNLISCGEICKLSDFEYAEPYELRLGPEEYTTAKSGGIKTGTPAFMAIEVQRGEYRYTAETREVHSTELGAWERTLQLRPKTNARPVFRYNYLHDIESLWWMAMWVFFKTRPALSTPSTPLEAMDLIFPYSLAGSRYRDDFFTNTADAFYKSAAQLPAPFRSSIECVNLVRRYLNILYQDFIIPPPPGSPGFDFEPVYGHVIEQMIAAAENSTAEKIVVTSKYYAKTEAAEPERDHEANGNADEVDVLASASSKLSIGDE
ncbi:hypothetical protein QCA50_016767 [Cerrena zonata]|uniref:Fungal-type protein kinase domain-containing protein n=1 Tax=Cerrena zonata TaxID=2478898 RepID=A0AAW0FEX2_9APHY